MSATTLPDFIMLPTEQLLHQRWRDASANDRDALRSESQKPGWIMAGDACPHVVSTSGNLVSSLAVPTPALADRQCGDTDTLASFLTAEYCLAPSEEEAALTRLRATAGRVAVVRHTFFADSLPASAPTKRSRHETESDRACSRPDAASQSRNGLPRNDPDEMARPRKRHAPLASL